MSRPTKLTPPVENVILAALRRGHTRTAAFEAAGVHHSKIAPWLARFAAFRGAVERAEAEAEIEAADTIHDAYKGGDWKAALAWLERRRSNEWGKVDRIEIQVRRAAEHVAQQTGADPDWLVKRAAEIAAAESGAEW
jgi:hypothetical protein